jgi:hypothetical protein
LVILEIVDRLEMQNNNPPNNNSAFQIQLKDEFRWFLSDEFKKLRQDFGKEYYDEYISSKQESKEIEDQEQEERDET